MAGSNGTVSKFDIELLLKSDIVKSLQSMERKVNAAAKRITKTLENSFNMRGRGAMQFQKELNSIVRSSAAAGKLINQNLQLKGVSNQANQFAASWERASRSVRQSMGKANSAVRSSGYRPQSFSRGGSTIPRLTPEERRAAALERMGGRAVDRVHALQYGSTMSRLREGGYHEQANAYRQAARNALFTFRQNGDMGAFNRSIREATASQRTFLAAQRTSSLGIASAGEGLIGAFGGIAAAVFSAQKAIELFQESLQVGIERYQSETMVNGIFGKDAPQVAKALDQIVQDYGNNKAETYRAAATLRGTLPDTISNAQIPGIMKNEAIYAHQTGQSNVQVFRMNHMLSEAASSVHAMSRIVNALNSDAPGLVARAAKYNNMTLEQYTGEHRKSVSGAQYASELFAAQERFNRETGADKAARESMQKYIGNYQNSADTALNRFFLGYQEGFKHLLGSLSALFDSLGSSSEDIGKGLGWTFDRLSDITDGLTNFIRHAHAMFMEMNKGLSEIQNNPVYKKLFGTDDDKKGDGGPTRTAGQIATAGVDSAAALGLYHVGKGVVKAPFKAANRIAGKLAGKEAAPLTESLLARIGLGETTAALMDVPFVNAAAMTAYLGSEQYKAISNVSAKHPDMNPSGYGYPMLPVYPGAKHVDDKGTSFSDVLDSISKHWNGFMNSNASLVPSGLKPEYTSNVSLLRANQRMQQEQTFKSTLEINLKQDGSSIARFVMDTAKDVLHTQTVNMKPPVAAWGDHPQSTPATVAPFRLPQQAPAQ
ncbi:TPA: hypothetical protein N3288_000225 [Klebsiella aerogenes]|nr:hypothetical protein [Klebsiella aerogenes]